jgi:uncharacterized protein YyaL (SSP411 family)
MSIHNAVTFDHLDRMTDGTGLIQHAIYQVPRRESGYTTDDNARALRLCARMWREGADPKMLDRVTQYLSFLEHARCAGGGFHNFMSYERTWLDEQGTGDCQGQAFRGLAEVAASALPNGFRALALELLEESLPVLAELRCLRAQAYVILGWAHLRAKRVPKIADLESIAWSAAERLLGAYRHYARPDWAWFEPRLTYGNAVLPHALFAAGRCWPDGEFWDVAEIAFDFLDQATAEDGVFVPVGNDGWYSCDGVKSCYDQQPIEAATMAEAAADAFQARRDPKYLETFGRARDWFLGRNNVRVSLAEPQTGACCDGLHADGANHNQGAESTLAYLWTSVLQSEMKHELERAVPHQRATRQAHERLHSR